MVDPNNHQKHSGLDNGCINIIIYIVEVNPIKEKRFFFEYRKEMKMNNITQISIDIIKNENDHDSKKTRIKNIL